MVDLIGKDLALNVEKAAIDIYKKVNWFLQPFQSHLLTFPQASEYAASKGIIIADTKFEFGIDENGTLVLADEVLTPGIQTEKGRGE